MQIWSYQKKKYNCTSKLTTMRIINLTRLHSNMKKCTPYQKQVIIQQNSFADTKEKYLEPDADLAKAISLEEFSIEAKKHIRKLYSQNKR